MVYKAKAIAVENVEGSFKEQYKRICVYAHEILARNPRSTIKVNVEENEGQPIFKRFYACLKACKHSFISCRPIIRLNGDFLKGKHGGKLLTIIGRDANDQMLPFAYVVVEVENKDSWIWFLKLPIEDLGGATMCASFKPTEGKFEFRFLFYVHLLLSLLNGFNALNSINVEDSCSDTIHNQGRGE